MWYPPQNNIALHLPHSYCLLLAQSNRLRPLSLSFISICMCVCVCGCEWVLFMYILRIIVCAYCVYMTSYVCVCLLEMFHFIYTYWTRPNIQTNSNRFFAHHRIEFRFVRSWKFVIISLKKQTIYFFMNSIKHIFFADETFIQIKMKFSNWLPTWNSLCCLA